MKKPQIITATLLAIAIFVWLSPQNSYAQETKTTYICVSVYSDFNGNGVMEVGEGLVNGAFVQIFDSTGRKIAWYTTDINYDPLCTLVEAGRHRITVKPPDDFTYTTKGEWEFEVPEGATANLEFGVQRTERAVAELRPTPTKNPLSRFFDFAFGLVLGVISYLIIGYQCACAGAILGGAAVWLIGRTRRPSTPPPA